MEFAEYLPQTHGVAATGMKNKSDGTLAWGHRFGDLVNALLDLGVRMQSVRYKSHEPNRATFTVRPPVRFVMHYEVDACPLPGMIHIKRIAVVFSIGRFDFQDKLEEPVSRTAQRIVDWAKGKTQT
jgi:hypothetical protein